MEKKSPAADFELGGERRWWRPGNVLNLSQAFLKSFTGDRSLR
jgi:hypothetical protein